MHNIAHSDRGTWMMTRDNIILYCRSTHILYSYARTTLHNIIMRARHDDIIVYRGGDRFEEIQSSFVFALFSSRTKTDTCTGCVVHDNMTRYYILLWYVDSFFVIIILPRRRRRRRAVRSRIQQQQLGIILYTNCTHRTTSSRNLISSFRIL